MATIIVQGDADWDALNAKYLAEHQPRNVILNSTIYECYQNINGVMEFKEVEAIDYIDSRSIKGSKKASYSKLDSGG